MFIKMIITKETCYLLACIQYLWLGMKNALDLQQIEYMIQTILALVQWLWKAMHYYTNHMTRSGTVRGWGGVNATVDNFVTGSSNRDATSIFHCKKMKKSWILVKWSKMDWKTNESRYISGDKKNWNHD